MEFSYKDLNELLKNVSKKLTETPKIKYPVFETCKIISLKASQRLVPLYEKILSNMKNYSLVIAAINITLTDIKRDYELILYMLNYKKSLIKVIGDQGEELISQFNNIINDYIEILDIIMQLSYYIDSEDKVSKMIDYLIGIQGNIGLLKAIFKAGNKQEIEMQDKEENDQSSQSRERD